MQNELLGTSYSVGEDDIHVKKKCFVIIISEKFYVN